LIGVLGCAINFWRIPNGGGDASVARCTDAGITLSWGVVPELHHQKVCNQFSPPCNF
jgi:hypothetical protein